MTSATTNTDRLAEDERMLDSLANNIFGIHTINNNIHIINNNAEPDGGVDDGHRTIVPKGGDTRVATSSTGTASPSVMFPLDGSIVSPPLLSDSVDQSLTNDLASAMAYALNMPTAREITEVLQDLYILPDYRMANNDEYMYYSDTDDYSTSSSEHKHARRQQQRKSHRPSASAIYSSKAKKKSKSDTKAVVSSSPGNA